jgi:hypothetical protein
MDWVVAQWSEGGHTTRDIEVAWTPPSPSI